MIRRCNSKYIEKIYCIINQAGKAYKGKIPGDRYHEPNMPMDELVREMKRITFYGWQENSELVAVMGIEKVSDVTLIRYAYVLSRWQRRGIAGKLLRRLKELVTTPRLLVGIWATVDWAISFYEKHCLKMMPDKDKLLTAYWDIPRHQIEESLVLGMDFQL